MSSIIKPRRNFLKTMGLGAAALSVPLITKTKTTEHSETSKHILNTTLLNGFEFELLFSGENFLGLGDISSGSVKLRNNRLPMFVHINTPEANEMLNFKLTGKKITGELIELDFAFQEQPGSTMEWMLHTVRNRRNMTDWTKNPEEAQDTHLTMIIKPVERKLGKNLVKGFSYQYIYTSKNYPIYKITDRSSWEIGGIAEGNELWMRNGVVESVKSFLEPNDFYSTEWYLPNIANPNIFQFHPFQTTLQGFTFTSAREGTLLTWASQVSHVRTLLEKWRGYNQIIHFHEHCNDLGTELKTVPMEVLWLPGELDRTGRANLYNDMRELVHEELHSQAGIKRERVSTYGIMEEWTEPDFDYYREKGLPKLLEAGVKTIMIPNQCQNDMNTWGLSNFCCNVDFKISETVGEDKLKRFCSDAKNGGARVEMWGNTAISTITERFMHHQGKSQRIKFLPYKGSIMEVIDKAKSPFIRNASNAIEADHYTPRFCVLNLRDNDIRAYWIQQWKYFYDEIGIEGIFLDSSCNMSSDKFHHAQFDDSQSWGGVTIDQKGVTGKYRPEKEPPRLIHSQYFAHLSLIAEMQKTGYHYSGEDMGVFGVNRSGPSLAERLDSLPIWVDCYCDFNEETVRNAGFDPMEIFFRGLAYRMMWKLYWDIARDKLNLGTNNPNAFKLLKVFNSVSGYMFNREILPGEKGVIYKLGNTTILWAFENFDFTADAINKVIEVAENKVVRVSKHSFSAARLGVYKISHSS